MSLLDDVSIVVTPNGYKAGELYAVVPVPTEGSEEIATPDFSSSTGWSFTNSGGSNGWIINAGRAICDASATTPYRNLNSTFSLVNGKSYRLIIDILQSSDNMQIVIGGTTLAETLPTGTNLNYEYFIPEAVHSGGGFTIYAGSSDLQEIDNVSVKEYTSADMDVTRATAATRVDENGLVNYAEVVSTDNVILNPNMDNSIPLGTAGSGWAQSGGIVEFFDGGLKLTKLSTSSRVRAKTITNSSAVLQPDTRYQFTYDIVSNNNVASDGTILYVSGALTSSIPNTVGSHIFNFTSGSNTNGIFQLYNNTNNSDITFDNTFVKEVTRDNVPRIDYTGGGCPHILAEPQRTNLITYSEDFTQWGVGETVVVANQLTSPSGEITADKLNALNSINQQYISISPTVSSGSVYTLSCFAKKGEVDYIALVGLNPFTQSFFDLNNGTVLGNTATSSSIEDFGNGWYRCTSTFDADTTSKFSGIYLSYDGTSISNGSSISNGEGVYIYGAQLEQGSYATSYIPTSGSTVTRNQDIFTRDGIGSLINSTEGVLFAEMAALSDDLTNRRITISDGVGNNDVGFRFNNSSNTIQVVSYINSSVIVNESYVLSDITVIKKYALKWALNNYALWVDGVEVITDISAISFPADTLNTLNFGSATGSSPFFGKVKQLQVYNTALTDEQLTSLTS